MINGTVVFQARVRAGMSLTRLSRTTGLSYAQLNDIERDRHVEATVITLEIGPDDLLTSTEHVHDPGSGPVPQTPARNVSPDGQSDDDARVLAALLLSASTFRASDITTTLRGWHDVRARDAVCALNVILGPAGLSFHQAGDGTYSLTTTCGQTVRPEHLRRTMSATRGGTPASMRLAHRLIGGPVPLERATFAEAKTVAELEALGILRQDHKLGAIGLTEEAAFGLLLPSAGWPRSGHATSTPGPDDRP